MNKIAVVILNWNGCDMLHSFLPSVVRFSEADGAVVYVADNGSTDASVDMLCREFLTVRLILLEENQGFADGYNMALQEVDAEYVVLLNSDVEVTEHWLQPLVDYMDAHPEAAACQPKIRSWRQKEMFEYAGAAGGFLDRYGYPFCRGRIMGVVEKDEGQYARGRQIDCVPQSVVYHVGGATLKKENPRKTFLNFRNNLVMLYKNLPSKDFASVMRTRAVLDYIAALSFILKLQFPNALAVLRARREYRLLRSSFTPAREENLKKTSLSVIPEWTKSSILAQYYLRGKKFFSQL